VDVELLAACAREYPGWTFPIFGPVERSVDLSPLRDLPNVSVQGRVAYERVPAIMQAFDVGLMPFRPGAISDYANPVTLYEFLALGKPVVCTPLQDIEGLDGLIFVSRNEFVPNVERASHARGEHLAHRRRAVADSHSWDALVHGVLSSLPL
ncbi:MAG TPA: glycosyltransferase, partial [Planctomycetota bacterium]|nr:glycosyltransferase [Planctomycetota bacterium]